MVILGGFWRLEIYMQKAEPGGKIFLHKKNLEIKGPGNRAEALKTALDEIQAMKNNGHMPALHSGEFSLIYQERLMPKFEQ